MLGPIICVHVMIIHSAQKILKVLSVCLWLWAESYDWSNNTPIWLCYNYVIHSVHKVITL